MSYTSTTQTTEHNGRPNINKQQSSKAILRWWPTRDGLRVGLSSAFVQFVNPQTWQNLASMILNSDPQREQNILLLKPPLHVETFSWNLCATALWNKFQQALHRVTWSWNFLNFRCETSFTKSRTAFYFCNGSQEGQNTVAHGLKKETTAPLSTGSKFMDRIFEEQIRIYNAKIKRLWVLWKQ